ncbi:aldose 1-epimerase family protein [Armatimonas sp.]|uniref:aldose 1-epimerase family protein n=1 Tax=Armatimonas sp. TaxID=1872638 RepID=UPI00286CA5C0|nr:aldose 1-epimerase family protein [Armatimonas sp.]
MATLFGKSYTRREVRQRVGELVQVAGVERFTYDEGVQGGVKAARVRSGGGLDFTVLFSRGMDIGAASLFGVPFAWVSATGWASPHAFVPEGRGWLQTFHGGLLTGCGLSNAGASNQDGEEALGIHGRLSHIPAEDTCARTQWDGDEATILLEGTMREATVFGENLRLTRTISTPVGGTSMTITDTVTNEGFKTSPLMLLYHLNFGWPLVEEGTIIRFPEGTTSVPRDADAAAGHATANTLTAPTPDYAEQCFFHNIPGEDVEIEMVNPSGFGVRISYKQSEFPHLTVWKMMGEGEYVCGIEPANCKVLGRAAEREAGRLQYIAPGETRTFSVTLTAFLEDKG